ncbi:uncharacterized protein [Henckelia pumila]|uniref:uncharacterized protein isoform X2 n=1 Tax=Henckelia pumila TaxID=405737 RepID=UPI003C6E3E7B
MSCLYASTPRSELILDESRVIHLFAYDLLNLFLYISRLLTPPGTPLFPSLEMESQKTVMSQLGAQKARPTSLKSRLANPMPEPARSNLSSRQLNSSSGLNTSTGGLHRPSSSGGGPGSRPSTPTRPTLSSTSSRSTSTPASNRRTLSTVTKPSTTSKVTSTATSRPSRSATPTARPTLTSAKPVVPPRSSTPTARSSIRSSTPTSRPSISAPKSLPRTATPTRRPTVPSSTSAVSLKSPTSSVDKTVTTAVKNPMMPRSNSPSVKPRPWKPSDIPGFSLDAPPNLRTSLPDRPLSATRGRPGALSSRSTSIEPNSNGRIRRQSCSPSRKRPPNGLVHGSGSSVPVPALTRLHAKANDNVSPVLIGSKMVERVINMRKLVPPKQDDKLSPLRNLSGKSSSPDSSGFGRNLSKKSLDMAIRHMDIRRTIPGNPRSLIPASSIKFGPNRSRTVSISDSPLATSSNASSEMSVNNNALCVDGPGAYDEVSSSKSIRSPSSLHGR